MNGRTSKLLRRFSAKQLRHGVHVFQRRLRAKYDTLSHRDRAAMRRRLVTLYVGEVPIVTLTDGSKIDLRRYAARLVKGKSDAAL